MCLLLSEGLGVVKIVAGEGRAFLARATIFSLIAKSQLITAVQLIYHSSARYHCPDHQNRTVHRHFPTYQRFKLHCCLLLPDMNSQK